MLLLGIALCDAAPQPMVQKIFYHKGLRQDRIVLYLSDIASLKKQPIINKKSNLQEQQFFLSACLSTDEDVLQAIKRLHAPETNWYQITIASIQKPSRGLLITIRYDVTKIKAIRYDTFDAISGCKGIAFTILYKDKAPTRSLPYSGELCVQGATKPTIILDFGHGGYDTGTIGINQQVEKDITFAIGTRLKNLLIKNGYGVCLTRTGDYFVALDDRSSFANLFTNGAIFISLHANYASNKIAHGIETHFGSNALLSTMTKEQKNLNRQEQLLAHCVHEHLVKTAKEFANDMLDRGKKQSGSQVLLGTEMPAILVELGFLSHAKESARLSDPHYQQVLTQGLLQGINTYFAHINRS